MKMAQYTVERAFTVERRWVCEETGEPMVPSQISSEHKSAINHDLLTELNALQAPKAFDVKAFWRNLGPLIIFRRPHELTDSDREMIAEGIFIAVDPDRPLAGCSFSARLFATRKALAKAGRSFVKDALRVRVYWAR